MLIDTREDPPDPGRRALPSWLSVVLTWLFPWPAAIVWLIAASLMTDGWIGASLAWAACGLTVWRLQHAFAGVGGLRDHRQ
jgi:uncharacterized RDD family membrane protein YckC